MDDEATGAANDEPSDVVTGTDADAMASTEPDAATSEAAAGAADDEAPDASPAEEIIDLPWDDDLPVALGEETEAREAPEGEGDDEASDRSEWEHEYEFDDGERAERYFARRKAERRADSWRTRSATGAIATAIAMGLQQVFEPEKRRPAAVAEAPSDPYSDDDPVTVEYVPDDAEATTVRVKPWLLQKGDPS